MMTHFSSKILLLLFCAFSLASCKNGDFRRTSLDNYIIEMGDLVSDTKVCRISNVVNIKTISRFSIKYDWTYDIGTLFFEPESCPMSRAELGAFLSRFQQSEIKFEKNKDNCIGTPFYTYNEKKNIESVEVSIEATDIIDNDSLSKNYAFFFISDLQEYKVTSKRDDTIFSLFVSLSDMVVSFESV